MEIIYTQAYRSYVTPHLTRSRSYRTQKKRGGGEEIAEKEIRGHYVHSFHLSSSSLIYTINLLPIMLSTPPTQCHVCYAMSFSIPYIQTENAYQCRLIDAKMMGPDRMGIICFVVLYAEIHASCCVVSSILMPSSLSCTTPAS